MISPNNASVTVPSVPSPRKNKLILKGRFNIWDLFIVIPILVFVIVIFLAVPLKWWVNLLIALGLFGIMMILIWPLSALGKEKLYIYILRGFSFLATRRHFAVCDHKTMEYEDMVKADIQQINQKQQELKDKK